MLKQLAKCTQSISNPEEAIEQALILSSRLPIVWNISDTDTKESSRNSYFLMESCMIAKMRHFELPKSTQFSPG